MQLIRAVGLIVMSLLVGPIAHAQIVIGQTSGFTGPASTGVKENTDGAKLWFDHINRQGGVHGQKIELVSLDDKFQPGLAAVNAKRLITEFRAVALFLNRGTAHSEAIRPLLEEHEVPLVAPSTGAMVLHRPVNRWIFNVRPSYARETEKTVLLLSSMGLKRIALVHVNDSAGLDGATGALKGFEGSRLKPITVLTFDRDKPDFKEIVSQVVRYDAQAVLLLGSAGAVADGIQALRSAGSKAQVVTISNNASDGFIKLLGPNARGTIVSQVFPHERSSAKPFVKQALDLASVKGHRAVTPAMLEGFAGAKVLVEGLLRAGPKPSGKQLRDALEGMRRIDIGGLDLGYSADDHTGLEYTDLSIIGATGAFER